MSRATRTVLTGMDTSTTFGTQGLKKLTLTLNKLEEVLKHVQEFMNREDIAEEWRSIAMEQFKRTFAQAQKIV